MYLRVLRAVAAVAARRIVAVSLLK